MGMTITKPERAQFIDSIKQSLNCIERKKLSAIEKHAQALKLSIQNSVDLANSYTSVWNQLRALFGQKPVLISFHDYSIPTLEDLQALIWESDGNHDLDASEFIPPRLMCLGQEYVTRNFGRFKHPFAQYIELKKDLVRLLEIFALAELVEQPITLELNEMLVLARAQAMLGANKESE